MWITKTQYDELVKEAAEQRGVARALEGQIIANRATIDWLSMRLNQLEHERAKLVEHYMGVKIPVQEIQSAPAERSALDDMLRNPGDLFVDMGDDEAQKLGIGWNEDGAVQYGMRK